MSTTREREQAVIAGFDSVEEMLLAEIADLKAKLAEAAKVLSLTSSQIQHWEDLAGACFDWCVKCKVEAAIDAAIEEKA